LLITGRSAWGQDNKTLENLKTRVAGFFTKLADKEQQPKQVFKDILAEGPLAKRNEAIGNLVIRFERLKKDCGKYLGSEAVFERKAGSDLVILKFLYKAENYPVVWYFTFYHRPDDKKNKWILISLRFDTRLEQLEP